MKLARTNNGMVAGVASGIARATNFSPTLVRLAFLVTALLGWGVLLYLVLWLVLPRDSDGGSVAEEGIAKARNWYDTQKH